MSSKKKLLGSTEAS